MDNDLTRYFEDKDICSESWQGTHTLSSMIARDPCDILVYKIFWGDSIPPEFHVGVNGG